MADTTYSARIEQRIEIETSPERVWTVLTDPTYIAQFAGGIEGAEVIDKPHGDYEGAILELVTKGNNILRAVVKEATTHRRLVVEDERGVVSTWTIQDLGNGRVRLENIIQGPISPQKANTVRYDADVKFQALQRILESEGTDTPVGGAG